MLVSAFLIALLAITMVIGVQTFDHLAEYSGDATARILPLDKLFDGIAAQPFATEYWWVYALLLSTTIPSQIREYMSWDQRHWRDRNSRHERGDRRTPCGTR